MATESELRQRPFRHEPLQSSASTLRIFKILPTPEESILQLELFHIDRPQDTDSDEVPKYTAVSYVCGPPKPDFAILINGCSYAIPYNLTRFLLEMRREKRDDRFWADAICIDSGNTTERSQQVAQMHQTYREAAKMFMWLGDDTPRRAFLFSVISNVVPMMRPYFGSGERGGDIFFRLIEQLDPEFRRHFYDDLVHFCQTEQYFQRTWTSQEIRLGGHMGFLISGSQMLSWRAVATLIWESEWGDHPREYPPLEVVVAIQRSPLFQHLSQFSGATFGPRTRAPLSLVLPFVRDTKCSDARDRLFAVRSICTEGHANLIPVDYSLTATQLFFDVLKRASASKTENISETLFGDDPWVDLMKALELTPGEILTSSLMDDILGEEVSSNVNEDHAMVPRIWEIRQQRGLSRLEKSAALRKLLEKWTSQLPEREP